MLPAAAKSTILVDISFYSFSNNSTLLTLNSLPSKPSVVCLLPDTEMQS